MTDLIDPERQRPVVDCYPDEPVWGSAPEDRPIEFELQFTPLFDDSGA